MKLIVGLRHRARRIFFGWWIVLSGATIGGLGAALYLQSFGAYFVKLEEEFGWSKTTLSAGYSLAGLVSGVLQPVQGWLIDKIGPRWVVRLGVVMFAGGLMLLSQVNSVIGYYGVALLLTTGANFTSLLTVTVAVAQWFRRRRTTAISLSLVGSSFGGFGVPLIAWSLTHYGWRDTALFSGVLFLILGLPLAQFFRGAPEAYGLLPDGDQPDADTPTPEQEREHDRQTPSPGGRLVLEGLTARETLRTSAFWLIGIGQTLAVLGMGIVMVHLIPYLVDERDFSLVFAGAMVTVSLGAMMGAQILGGFVSDRFNKRVIMALTMVGNGSALVILSFASTLPLVILFAVLHGASSGFRLPLILSLRAEYFGRRALGAVLGFGQMFAMVGQTIGPIFGGVMVDRLNTYHQAFLIVAGFIFLGAIVFALAAPPKVRQHQGATRTHD